MLGGQAVEAVTAEKKQIIRKSGLLEYYDNTELIDNVGGLGVLKEWLRKRVRAFTDEARAFGLPAPKGILLVGVQGCGKSLIARSVANMWRLPLLRLDAGRLFASLVGSSEENLRQAIKTAESIAPAVLWVDEIEKGFAGVGSSNVSDAGTAARVFGSFHHLAAREAEARLCRRHRQRHLQLAAGTGAQGALRRDILRRPADRRRTHGDLAHPPDRSATVPPTSSTSPRWRWLRRDSPAPRSSRR
jgi:SpoVK/Ycf46/Vps4 family AAA+-type ATPase